MAETLNTGTYKPSTDIRVTYWPAPDKDGDGEEVWEDQHDHNGNSLGRFLAKDQQGEPLYHYEAPEGFTNRPGFDHTDNYVRCDNKGRILRDVDGNAMGIREGHALVEYPNGKTELLKDDYARHLFAKSHEKVSDEVTDHESVANAAKKRPVTVPEDDEVPE